MFSKKATKIDEIFTVDLTLCSKYQIYHEDFVNFRGLLRKYELYVFSQNKMMLTQPKNLINFDPPEIPYSELTLLSTQDKGTKIDLPVP